MYKLLDNKEAEELSEDSISDSNYEDNLNQDPTRKDFLYKHKDNTVEEIISYNKIIKNPQNQETEEDQLE